MGAEKTFELPSNMFVRIKKNTYGVMVASLYERRWHGIPKLLIYDDLAAYSPSRTVRAVAKDLYEREMVWQERQSRRTAAEKARKAAHKRLLGKYPPKNMDVVIGEGL